MKKIKLLVLVFFATSSAFATPMDPYSLLVNGTVSNILAIYFGEHGYYEAGNFNCGNISGRECVPTLADVEKIQEKLDLAVQAYPSFAHARAKQIREEANTLDLLAQQEFKRIGANQFSTALSKIKDRMHIYWVNSNHFEEIYPYLTTDENTPEVMEVIAEQEFSKIRSDKQGLSALVEFLKRRGNLSDDRQLIQEYKFIMGEPTRVEMGITDPWVKSHQGVAGRPLYYAETADQALIWNSYYDDNSYHGEELGFNQYLNFDKSCEFDDYNDLKDVLDYSVFAPRVKGEGYKTLKTDLSVLRFVLNGNKNHPLKVKCVKGKLGSLAKYNAKTHTLTQFYYVERVRGRDGHIYKQAYRYPVPELLASKLGLNSEVHNRISK